MNTQTDNVLPSTDGRIQLKVMLVEMTKLMRQNDDNREALKEIASAAQSKYGIKKKFVSKLAKIMYNQSYADLQSENQHFEMLYESIVEGKKT